MARSQQVEAFLIRESVPFTFIEKVPLDRIDYPKSLGNQARIAERLKAETVEDYALKMIDGEDFPGVIVYPDEKSGLYTLADGLHRVSAAKEAEIATIDCYVMEKYDALTLDIVTRTVNRGHGLNLDRGDTLEQARYFVERWKFTPEQAAHKMGVAPAQVEAYLRAMETYKRLSWLNVPAAKFAWPVTAELGRIEPDSVLRVAAENVRSWAMSEADARILVDRILVQRSEAGMLSAIEREVEARLAISKRRGAVARPNAAAIKRYLSQMNNHLRDNPSKAANAVTDEEVNEIDGSWRQLIGRMEYFLAS